MGGLDLVSPSLSPPISRSFLFPTSAFRLPTYLRFSPTVIPFKPLTLSPSQLLNLYFFCLNPTVCLIPISITKAVNPQPLRVSRYDLIKLFQLALFSMVGSFAAGLINGSFYSLGPILA